MADWKAHAYPRALFGAFVIVAGLFGVFSEYRQGWFIENLLVIGFLPVLGLTIGRFPLSDVSLTLVFLFLALHEVGSFWSYHVPLGWTGWETDRYMYDRVVHFGFGLFMAYPIREVLVRVIVARGFWTYYLPLDLVLAFSALYEIVEWLAALVLAPGAADRFVGMQGDIFDPIKDMALAGAGAAIAMLVTARVHASRGSSGQVALSNGQ